MKWIAGLGQNCHTCRIEPWREGAGVVGQYGRHVADGRAAGHRRAEHRFYDKSGFKEITVAQLPASFRIMKVDTRMKLSQRAPFAASSGEGPRLGC
jgi:hypothetical protein